MSISLAVIFGPALLFHFAAMGRLNRDGYMGLIQPNDTSIAVNAGQGSKEGASAFPSPVLALRLAEK